MPGRRRQPPLRGGAARWVRALVAAGMVAVLSLAPSTAGAALGDPPPSAADVAAAERYLRRELDATRIPGAAWAIVTGDGVVTGAHGRADPAGRPATATTPFVVGSLTKSMTALAVLRLADRGVLDPESPVERYLPWFRVAGQRSPMTVLDAVHHTTGISLRTGLAGFDSDDRDPGAFRRRVERLADASTGPPGEAFEYSNANYAILGAVVEAATGDPYGEVLREEVLDPLGMTGTSTERSAAVADGLAVGHRYWFGHPVAARDLPHGNDNLASFLVMSTAADMGRYLVGQRDNRAADGTPLLSARTLPLLHGRGVPTGQGQDYAAGWFVGERGGRTLLEHAGSYAGYHADMRLDIDAGLGIVLLTNAESYAGAPRRWAVADGALAVLGGAEPERPGGVDAVLVLLYALPLAFAAIGVDVVRVARTPRGGPPRRLRGVVVSTLLLAVGLAVLLGTPVVFDATLTTIRFTTPDAGWGLLLLGGALIAWAVLRPVAREWRHRLAVDRPASDATTAQR